MLGGGFFDLFNTPSHAGKEPLLALYRQRVLAFHGVPASAPPPSSHLLLLVKKQGRRGIANFEQVAAHVRGGCGGQCEGIARTQAVAFHTMSVREQLQLVSSATLAISPPGGVSMILPFMPEGSHVILLNYLLPDAGKGAPPQRQTHHECAGCSWTMEAELWNHVRHVRKLFYQVWEPSDFAGGRPGRDAAVLIKLPRLAFLLRAALNAMRPGEQGEEDGR